jgi:hypothetical protein
MTKKKKEKKHKKKGKVKEWKFKDMKTDYR